MMKELNVFSESNFSAYKERRITNLIELKELCKYCRLNDLCDCEYCEEAYSKYLNSNNKLEKEDLKAFVVKPINKYLDKLIAVAKSHSETDMKILGGVSIESDSIFTVEVESNQKMFDMEFLCLLNNLPIDKINIHLDDVEDGTESDAKYEEGFMHTGKYKLTFEIIKVES